MILLFLERLRWNADARRKSILPGVLSHLRIFIEGFANVPKGPLILLPCPCDFDTD